jgi:hypothetical protein
MPEMSDRTASRLEPVTAWTIVTEAPLKGLAFAREAGRILAWDEGNQLYLLNAQGESLSFSRVPQRIVAGAMMPACCCSMPISGWASSGPLPASRRS